MLNKVHQFMKNRLLSFVAALSLAFVSTTHAQQGVSPAALIGTWKASAQHPSGATITSVVQLTQNMQFTSTSTANGAAFMEASGSWKLSGKTIEWRYEQSSHPAIQKGFVDVDEVESVSANEIFLVSKLSGKKRSYQRAP